LSAEDFVRSTKEENEAENGVKKEVEDEVEEDEDGEGDSDKQPTSPGMQLVLDILKRCRYFIALPGMSEQVNQLVT
jgi:hypothetical protein